jgi:hypothetical protein
MCSAAFCTGVSAAVFIANTGDYISGRAQAWVFAPTAAFVLILMAYAWRATTLSFRADGAGLVIHNMFRTRRVPVSQVVGFDVGSRSFRSPGVWVRVVTASGTYPIAAFGRRSILFPGYLLEIADDLQSWLENARAGLTS